MVRGPVTADQAMLQELLNTLPQRGEIRWIGLRPKRRAPVQSVETAQATVDQGLVGDRYAGRPGGKRQITLIQWEHLAAIAGLLGLESVSPHLLRRNIAVSGINLLALKGKAFHCGSAILEFTGPCAPCSFMEETFGPGGYNAVRGHGGITARVLQDGEFHIGEALHWQPDETMSQPQPGG